MPLALVRCLSMTSVGTAMKEEQLPPFNCTPTVLPPKSAVEKEGLYERQAFPGIKRRNQKRMAPGSVGRHLRVAVPLGNHFSAKAMVIAADDFHLQIGEILSAVRFDHFFCVVEIFIGVGGFAFHQNSF